MRRRNAANQENETMDETSKPVNSHSGHNSPHGGSCCSGGGGADSKANLQAVPAEKTTDVSAGSAKTKPAESSGCCGG